MDAWCPSHCLTTTPVMNYFRSSTKLCPPPLLPRVIRRFSPQDIPFFRLMVMEYILLRAEAADMHRVR